MVGPLPPPGAGMGTDSEAAAVEYRLFGAATLGFDEVEAERAAIEAAERVRTLYVAMTRAKERLVLAGIWPQKDGMAPELARSHADLLLARRGRPEVAALWEQAAAEGTWAIEARDLNDLNDLHEPDNADDADNPTPPTTALWVFPALDPARAAAGEEPSAAAGRAAPPLPSPAAVARGAAEIAARREAAAARMARPFAGAAAAEAHAHLAELAAERGLGEAAAGAAAGAGGRAGARSAAMAAGSAVHRVLESWDFAAPWADELARQTARLPAHLAALAAGDAAAALARARGILARFAAGPLPARLAALAPGIVARELPVLLPPSAAGEGEGPLGFVAGAIDLVYREPGERPGEPRGAGRLVIADYKTDEVEDDAIADRAAAYAPQGAVYRRALAEALGLGRPPRFELWFLAAGRVVEV